MSDQLLMSVDPDSDITEDETVSVVLDRTKVHLFDTETGHALMHGLAPSTTASTDSSTPAESDD
jgi:multiple sugar transport system ATP-binding protein